MSAPDPDARATILVVDDSPENLHLVSGLLRDRYRVKVASHGEKALRLAAASPPPDLILLDVMLPGMDGLEVCQALQAAPGTRDIPVIFLTSKSRVEDEARGLALGAVDYITKPISPPILLARVHTHLTLKAAADFLKDQRAWLEAEVARRIRELSRVQDVTIMAMASLAETRDNETGHHLRRTQEYVKILAQALSVHPRFRDDLTPDRIELLVKSAPLHDIGKVGIPDRILLKPGRLDPEEFEVMKTHTTLGRDAILAAERLLDTPDSFLQCAREIAYSHQEKWDGSGYPQGLRGEEIPIPARLMALADVYDALMSRRVYKDAMDHDEVVEVIRRASGSHFDPDVVAAFLDHRETFRQIARRFTDYDPLSNRDTPDETT